MTPVKFRRTKSGAIVTGTLIAKHHMTPMGHADTWEWWEIDEGFTITCYTAEHPEGEVRKVNTWYRADTIQVDTDTVSLPV